MKKNGPQRSQSLSAFPGSSLYGLGNTTSFKLLTIRDRSRFTVSHTGSVNVLGGDPNALAPMFCEPPWELLELLITGRGGGTGTEVTLWADDDCGCGGRFDCINGEEETGIDGLVGLGGRAARTVPGPDWTLSLIRFSISSMSDWDDEWSGMVSPCDIFPDSFSPELDFPGK